MFLMYVFVLLSIALSLNGAAFPSPASSHDSVREVTCKSSAQEIADYLHYVHDEFGCNLECIEICEDLSQAGDVLKLRKTVELADDDHISEICYLVSRNAGLKPIACDAQTRFQCTVLKVFDVASIAPQKKREELLKSLEVACDTFSRKTFDEQIAALDRSFTFKYELWKSVAAGRVPMLDKRERHEFPHVQTIVAVAKEMRKRIDRWLRRVKEQDLDPYAYARLPLLYRHMFDWCVGSVQEDPKSTMQCREITGQLFLHAYEKAELPFGPSRMSEALLQCLKLVGVSPNTKISKGRTMFFAALTGYETLFGAAQWPAPVYPKKNFKKEVKRLKKWERFHDWFAENRMMLESLEEELETKIAVEQQKAGAAFQELRGCLPQGVQDVAPTWHYVVDLETVRSILQAGGRKGLGRLKDVEKDLSID